MEKKFMVFHNSTVKIVECQLVLVSCSPTSSAAALTGISLTKIQGRKRNQVKCEIKWKLVGRLTMKTFVVYDITDDRTRAAEEAVPRFREKVGLFRRRQGSGGNWPGCFPLFPGRRRNAGTLAHPLPEFS
ncbi:MAG: hypothetical protein K6U04_12620 [Armatimonadetes bacterium]|nr:hypothetical protein [Armatimonadota bacterium]